MDVPAIRRGLGAERSVAAPRAAAVLAGLVVAAAAVVRLAGLTDKAFWFDETVSVFFAQQPVVRLLALLPASDPHPPLHYLLLHAWIGRLGDGEAAVRSLSVLLSVSAVLVTWLFGRQIAGEGPALFAATLVAVAPAQVASGQEARMYGLLTLLALASWWALWRALGGAAREQEGEGRGAGAWAVYAAATAAMLYSHYYGFFVVASQAAFLLWRGLPAAQWRRAVYAGLGVVLLFLPWLPSFLDQVGAGRAWPAHRLPLTAAALPDTLAAMTVGRPVLELWGPRLPTIEAAGATGPALMGLGAAAALIVAALRDRSLRADRRRLLLAAAYGPVVGAFAVSLGLNVFAPRYLLFVVPPIGLLVGAGAAALAADRSARRRAAALLLPVLVLLPNVLGTVAFSRQPRLDAFDWRLVSRTLAAQARDDDAVVLLPGFSRLPINYYFRGPQPRLALTPDGTDVVGDAGARLPQITERLVGHRRVWIVTVPPVPPALDAVAEALVARGYTVTHQQAVNLVALILLERPGAP